MSATPRRLMIVDDNPSDVDFVRDAFAELAIPAEFMVAKDGVEAKTQLARVLSQHAVRPCAILLDLNMPRLGGLEVLAYVKRTAGLQTIPTIVLTSSSSPKDRDVCLAHGADAYLTKPRTLEQLDALVREIHAMLGRRAGEDPSADPAR